MESNTYCGRACESCTKKVAIGCPGCRVGPGRPIDGDCEIAKCCRNKGHQTCVTCTANVRCRLYHNRANAAEERLKRRQRAQEQLVERAETAKTMELWFKWLFWLSLASLLGSLLTNDLLKDWHNVTYIPGTILSLVGGILYVIILIKMRVQEQMYFKSALCVIVSCAVLALSVLMGEGGKALLTLLLLPLAVVNVLSVYYEFNAHSAFFEEVDSEMFYNWNLLWKLYLTAYCAVIGGVVLAFVSAALAVIVMVIGAIGQILVGILKLILLYRSTKKLHYFALEVLES